jgi:hypothetical protein
MIELSGKDFLCTNEYKKHHLFFFTMVINILVSFCTAHLMIYSDSIFLYLQGICFSNRYITYILIASLICVNLYEVVAHLFATLKYLGLSPDILMGTADKQILSKFAIATSIDIFGWILFFIYDGYAYWILAYLAGLHVGALVIALFFNKTFQQYYIAKLDKDVKVEFKSSWWNFFRISFVAFDGIVRGYVAYVIFQKF